MKHEDLVQKVFPNRPWYAVKYLLHDNKNKLYQEDTVLVKASSQDEALDKAEKIAEEFCETLPEYMFTGYAEVFQLFEAEPCEGSEVYSTLRKSDLNPEEYVKYFLRTGQEIGFKNIFE